MPGVGAGGDQTGAGSWHEPVNSQTRPDSPNGVVGGGAAGGYPGATVPGGGGAGAGAGGGGQSMYSSCKLQGPPSPPETKVGILT